MVPSPESRRSKNSFLPSSIFSVVCGFAAGTGTSFTGMSFPAYAVPAVMTAQRTNLNTLLTIAVSPSALPRTPNLLCRFQLLIDYLLEILKGPLPHHLPAIDVEGRSVVEVHVRRHLEISVDLLFELLCVDGIGEFLHINTEC